MSKNVNQNFQSHDHLEVVVSDLTYVNVNGKWNYICVLIDLFNLEIMGYSTGKNRNVDLVSNAFLCVKSPLNQIEIFHSDYAEYFGAREPLRRS